METRIIWVNFWNSYSICSLTVFLLYLFSFLVFILVTDPKLEKEKKKTLHINEVFHFKKRGEMHIHEETKYFFYFISLIV